VNGEELPDWQSQPGVAAYSNQLGEEGWELVSLVAGETTEQSYRIIFKRPKE
jgi:hypothetical protein